MKIKKTVNIIGAGFAGIETALFLASHGIKVHIFDRDYEKYKCDSLACEFFGKNHKNQNFAREVLREELKTLSSSLIEIEEKFYKGGLVECGCIGSRLLEEGRKLLNNNENIEVFKLNVKELDLDEINIVATGPHTDGKLFEWLKNHYGSMRCNDGVYENPVVENVDESLLYRKECDQSDDLYLPFNYEEYIELVNRIVKAHNDYLDLSGTKKITTGQNAIEKLIENGKDALKNQALRICKLEGYDERPYAVLRIKRVALGYELCGLSSSLPYILQDMIISSMKPFKNSKLVKEARILQNYYINSPYVINEHLQSLKDERVYFAGGLLGLDGHLEAMASGLIAGYSVLGYIYGKQFKALPYGTCIGSLLRKLISINISNSSPLLANYDIIEGYKALEDKNKFLGISKESLSKYVEDYYGWNKI